jgi:hypothetical protein
VDEHIRRVVDNAWVHPELEATLSHDIALDMERPEYHRVILERTSLPVGGGGCGGFSFAARSTGIQQSSRLISMRDADGLMILPQGFPNKPKALAGEIYTVLCLREVSFLAKSVLVSQSAHLNQKKSKSCRIGVVCMDSAEPGLDLLNERVGKALSGSRSGSVMVASAQSYCGPPKALYDLLRSNSDEIDIHVVVDGRTKPGSLRSSLELSSILRSQLAKVADAVALQARRGAASQDPTAALFEVVVGYLPVGRGSMVIALADRGLDGALSNVRGLLKHALSIARGN